MKKVLTIGIMLLFIGMTISSSVGFNVEKQSTVATLDRGTLYVGGIGPNNYTKIQDAINDSSDGDTVFVYSGIYKENLVVNTSIILMGEDKYSTIIEGNKSRGVITLLTHDVNINSFNIQNGSVGIRVNIPYESNFSYNNNISGNILYDNGIGIEISRSHDNTIYDNIISNNISINFNNFTSAIELFFDLVSMGFRSGIHVEYCPNSVIVGNTISNCTIGVSVSSYVDGDAQSSEISDNNISNCLLGVVISGYENEELIVLENIFSNNTVGLFIANDIGKNSVYDNTFFNDGLFILSETYPLDISNNTVNGKPIVCLQNESDKIIDDAGQVILINCENITIQNLELSNVLVGIELIFSDNCIIQENTISNNKFGILLHGSFYNTITQNTIIENSYDGIMFYSSFYNNISRNTIVSNNLNVHPLDLMGQLALDFLEINASGSITFYLSRNNLIEGNNISSNNRNGITFILSNKNRITHNSFKSNNGSGVILFGSCFNRFIQNNFIDNNEDPYFMTCFRNKWKENYWNEARLLPKPIIGYLNPGVLSYIIRLEGKNIISIPWINFDWRPAQEPYDI